MRWTRTLAVACLWLGAVAPLAHAVQLDIPAGHPRLWYGNAARLAQARTY
jgi:hypothetical protein